MSENNNSKQLTILTVAAVVMSVASLITAAAALYTLKYGNEREEARISRLAAVMEENAARNASPRSTSARTSKTKATTTSSQPTTSSSASSTSSQASGQAVAGSGSRTGGGNQPTDSAAAAGGAAQAQAQGQGQTDNTPQAANAPAPNSDQLLDAVIAATDPNSSAETRNGWAVDGSAAGNTLSEVAKIRSASAPPAGQEKKGIGPLTVTINDIVQTGDKATATIKIAFPGNWGAWTYENSGFQYVDGKWKLQKSAVCSLAKAAWTKCY